MTPNSSASIKKKNNNSAVYGDNSAYIINTHEVYTVRLRQLLETVLKSAGFDVQSSVRPNRRKKFVSWMRGGLQRERN